MNFINLLIQTTSDYLYFFLRIVAAAIIFPYGMQKLLGWFDDFGGGVGIKGTLEQMKKKKIPLSLAWMIILGQSVGSIALFLGLLSRVAAAGNFIIFTGALIVHRTGGWAINWTGKKSGEGVEYFVLLLTILLVIVVRGSGPLSIDFWMFTKMK